MSPSTLVALARIRSRAFDQNTRCDLQLGGANRNKSGAEMEKRVDAADASVLFFSLAVLFCWLYTRKLAIKELCYLHCAISTVR